MKIFSALFGEINGVFGKAYLLAGLLPALVLVFCANWYLSGNTISGMIDGLIAGTRETQEEPAKAGSEADAAAPQAAPGESGGLSNFTAAALLALGLGVVFFATRSWLLETLQTIPGRGLRWLNERLVARQLRKRRAAKMDEQTQDHFLTVIDWADPKSRNFDDPGSVPWFLDIPDLGTMTPASNKGRDLFKKLRADRKRAPTASECRTMLGGLSQLYLYAYGRFANPEVTAQIDMWRAQLTQADAWVLIEAVGDQAHRTWVDSTRARDNFPVEDKWVGPTQLGTRAAALDDYAQERYGIDTSLIVSRLAGVLSDDEKTGLSDSRLAVETLVNLSAASGAIALLVVISSLPFIWNWAINSAPIWIEFRAVAFLVAGAFASLVLYRGALHAFGGLAEKTTRAIDLNRLALLKQMGFATPADMAAERELWGQLAAFFAPGKPTLPVPDPPLQEPK